jgi:uracil phosphoribosyltransferase
MAKKLIVLDHPLKGGYLKNMRDKNSSSEMVRREVDRLSTLLTIEISKSFLTKEVLVESPLDTAYENVIFEEIALVPILRAGIGMVDPFLKMLPNVRVNFLGIYRDHDTSKPVSYYNNLENAKPVDNVIILDPMLATGGTVNLTIEELKKWGAKSIKFAGLIAAPEGVKSVHNAHPNVDIYLAALDKKLNIDDYIIPGLGDAGDRIFNS